MDNKKSLRTLSIIGTILGILMIVLSVIGLTSLPFFYIIILLTLLPNLLISVAGGLGINAASPSNDVNSICCSVTRCMVLSIIATFLNLPIFIFVLTLIIRSPFTSLFDIINLVILLVSAAELVVSIWSAVCCGRLGACCCCPQQQAQMVGQAVHYVPNQNGTMSTVQGTPAGTNQAYSSTTSGVVLQPVRAQAQASKYPPPYPGKEAGPTETNPPPYPGNPPPYPGKEAGPTETNPPPYPGKEAGPTESNPPPYPSEEAGPTETNVPL